MAKTALIAGASGLIGAQLLGKLLSSEKYKLVISIVRSKSASEHPKLNELIVDFDQLNLKDINQSIDDVFCCLGTTMKKAGSKEAFKKVDYEYPLELAKKTKSKGAQSYHLISSLGADANSSVFYSKVKGEIEEAIAHLGFTRYHIYQPSMLYGDRKEFRLGEKIGIVILKILKFLMIGPSKKYRGIDSSKVAKAMYSFAQKDQDGKFIHESDELQKF